MQNEAYEKLIQQNFWENFLSTKYGVIFDDSHYFSSYFCQLEETYIKSIITVLNYEKIFKKRNTIDEVCSASFSNHKFFQLVQSAKSTRSIYSRRQKTSTVNSSSYYRSTASFRVDT